MATTIRPPVAVRRVCSVSRARAIDARVSACGAAPGRRVAPAARSAARPPPGAAAAQVQPPAARRLCPAGAGEPASGGASMPLPPKGPASLPASHAEAALLRSVTVRGADERTSFGSNDTGAEMCALRRSTGRYSLGYGISALRTRRRSAAETFGGGAPRQGAAPRAEDDGNTHQLAF